MNDRAESSGGVAVYATTNEGGLREISRFSGWRSSWTSVVSGAFGGSSSSDLLLYDGPAGEVEIHTVDPAGQISRLNVHRDFGSSWSHIAAGQFSRADRSDIFCYDRTAGRAALYTCDDRGNLRLAHRLEGLGHAWDIVVSGEFGGDYRSDLLFYDRSGGRLEFHTVTKDGKLELLRAYQNQLTSWDMIIPLDVVAARRWNLLFYSRRYQLGRFFTIKEVARLTLAQSYPDWMESWDFIVPLRVRDSRVIHLFQYCRSSGLCQLVKVDEASQLEVLKRHTLWKDAWSRIVSGQFCREGMTDLFLYDRFACDDDAPKARRAIALRHVGLGGAEGVLDSPRGDLEKVGSGWRQAFWRGNIYWRPGHGAFEIFGPFVERYGSSGGLDGSLGFPTSDPSPLPFGAGTYQAFEEGILALRQGGALELLRTLTFSVDEIRQEKKIEDGWDSGGGNQNAELLLRIWVKVDGEYLPGIKGARVPEKGDMGPGGPVDFKCQIPARAQTVAEIKIQALDRDMVGADDYLGTWEFSYRIEDLLRAYVNRGESSAGMPIQRFEQESDAIQGLETLRLSISLKPDGYDDGWRVV